MGDREGERKPDSHERPHNKVTPAEKTWRRLEWALQTHDGRILQAEDTPDMFEGLSDAKVSGVDKNSGEVSRENSKMTVGTGSRVRGQMA